jgi:FkbM family methyltransferase
MTEPLSNNPTIAPKGMMRKIALLCINQYFLLRGMKFPPYFNLHGRLAVFRQGVEPDIQHVCTRLVREGMIVMDVGANIGFLTRQFCRQVGPRGRVFAFEPDPLNFQYLEFNTRSCMNLERVHCAISDNHEPALLHLNSFSGTGNSLLNKTYSTQSISVPCISLDEFLNKNGNPAVNLIKIDVEGAELNVLRGMRQTMSRLPGLIMIIEYCPKNLNGSGVEPRAVYDEIAANGFHMQSICPDGSTQDVSGFTGLNSMLNVDGYTNLLCTRSKP